MRKLLEIIGMAKKNISEKEKSLQYLLVAVDPVGRIIPLGPLIFDSMEEARGCGLIPPAGCYFSILPVWK